MVKYILFFLVLTLNIACNPLYHYYPLKHQIGNKDIENIDSKVEMKIEGSYFFISEFIVSSFILTVKNKSKDKVIIDLNNIELSSDYFTYKLKKDFVNTLVVDMEELKKYNISFGADISLSLIEEKIYNKKDDLVELKISGKYNNKDFTIKKKFYMKDKKWK